MRLTLGIAKEKLASHSPAEVLEDRINRAIERILVDGKFNGSLDRIMLQVLYGDLTLPRQYRTVEGVKIDRNNDGSFRVRVLTNGWYEFLEAKVTVQDLNRQGFGMDTVQSRGDGWPIMHDLPQGGFFQLAFTGSPNPTVTISGRDANFMPIQLVLNNTTITANPFTRIDRVHMGITPFVTFLTHVTDNPVISTTVTTNLAIMEPLEQETFYRRYHDDSLSNVPTCNAICYVKKRHLEYESDNDILEITNLTALGFEMDSLQYMAENDISVANQYHDEAIRVLNEELKDVHAVDEVPTLRFRYPGGCNRLVSHY
jgi:hypothetical protein